jgi:hypothetical protein
VVCQEQAQSLRLCPHQSPPVRTQQLYLQTPLELT